MLSSTTEYALRAVVWLASRGGAPATTDQIARATEVPAAYLSKVLQTLGKAHVVRSQRGVGGGFTMAREPREITALEIIDAVEPLRRLHSCPLKLAAHSSRLCPLHERLDAAIAMVRDAFSNCTIFDLISAPDGASPLCGLRGEDQAAADGSGDAE